MRFDQAAGEREGVEGEVAPLGGDPFFVLFGEHGADEADDAVAGGEDRDDVGASADLFVEPFDRVVAPDLPPDGRAEGGEGEQVGAGFLEQRRGCGEALFELGEAALVLLVDG